MRHLSIWILLLLLTACAHGDIKVETYIGGNASFLWNYTVPPFYAVQWFFEKTQIAVTLQEHISQGTLSINHNYTSRFYLLSEGDKIGFKLTNVESNDEGNYTCIATLQSTDVLVEKKGMLIVKDYTTHGTSTYSPGEGTTSKVTPTEDDNTIAIVFGVLIPFLAAIGLFGVFAFWKCRRKRRPKIWSLKERDRTEAETPMT